MDRSRELCVSMSPHIARVLFDTEHTEKAQRATEFIPLPSLWLATAFHASWVARSAVEQLR